MLYFTSRFFGGGMGFFFTPPSWYTSLTVAWGGFSGLLWKQKGSILYLLHSTLLLVVYKMDGHYRYFSMVDMLISEIYQLSYKFLLFILFTSTFCINYCSPSYPFFDRFMSFFFITVLTIVVMSRDELTNRKFCSLLTCSLIKNTEAHFLFQKNLGI